ncbi:MAG TPA: hypoxanthine phosphoribosyltransferase [Armatimonadota bacterium]|nr:hypoxanthine phosphoribosyltransferase [Armatimonadota bacterium]
MSFEGNERDMGDPEQYRANIARTLLTQEQIQAKVSELAAIVSQDYADCVPLLVGVLNGSAVFAADLIRALSVPAELEFVAATSYGDATESSGKCKMTKDIDRPLAGRHVLMVEDIVDTGRTLAAIVECIEARDPASVKVCTLLDKPARREVDMRPDYIGFEIPDEFVVGYGLDFARHYRGLPYVAVLKPEAYSTDANPGA